ncbi:hypothetical protein DY000_02046633 [Brassica cretica]|uniref:Uncharacterized protein n=1 Tax=Brassica cretica TaxID=69181 RepID=A0ABQ7F8E9_BRACR|nr:hypothetical protein DY000_02046633 [Brassica cretica]
MACGITDGPSKDFPMIRKMPINREFLWEAEMVKIKAQDLKGKEVRVSNFCKHCIIVTYKFAIGTAVRLNTRLLYQQTKFNLLREKARDMPNWDDLFNDAYLAFAFHTATLLCRGSASYSHNASPATMRIIKVLILPVLDCFEIERDYDMLLDLIPSLMLRKFLDLNFNTIRDWS